MFTEALVCPTVPHYIGLHREEVLHALSDMPLRGIYILRVNRAAICDEPLLCLPAEQGSPPSLAGNILSPLVPLQGRSLEWAKKSLKFFRFWIETNVEQVLQRMWKFCGKPLMLSGGSPKPTGSINSAANSLIERRTKTEKPRALFWISHSFK